VSFQDYFLLVAIVKLQKIIRNQSSVTTVYSCGFIARASRTFFKSHAKSRFLHNSQSPHQKNTKYGVIC